MAPSIVPKKKATKLSPSPYNPAAYVPGGAPPNVARAIQTQGGGPGPFNYTPPKIAPANTSGLGADYSDLGGSSPTLPALYDEKQRDWTPDEMQQMIVGDPMYGIGQERYQQALDRGYSNIVRTPTQQKARSFGAIDFTKVPSDIRDELQKLLGPAATEEDPMSTMAQLRTQLARGQAKIPYALAARNAGRSGASAVLNRRLNEGFGATTSQALNDLLTAISGMQGQYADFAGQQGSAWDTLREQIASRLAQKPGPTYREAREAALPHLPLETQAPESEWSPLFSDPVPMNPLSDYPFLNPTAPEQVYTPVNVGRNWSYEPKPTAANIIPKKKKK